MATLAPLRVPRRACLFLVCSLLALAAVPQALAQESPPQAEPPPAETVPADSTPAPDPDPAPAEQPPKEQPAPPAPAPTYSPPVSTYTPPPAPAGPTPEELAQRERERAQARRDRERKQAERLRKQREKSVKAGFAAFLDAATHAPAIEVPVVAPEAETQAPEPIVVEAASQEVAAPFSEPAPGASSLAGAGPILLGLLGLAVLLLGVAALPPWSIRSPALAGLLVHRRLEIGLVGTAVLASAAIGLAIAVAAG